MQEMRWQNRYLKSNCIKYRHGHFKVKKTRKQWKFNRTITSQVSLWCCCEVTSDEVTLGRSIRWERHEYVLSVSFSWCWQCREVHYSRDHVILSNYLFQLIFVKRNQTTEHDSDVWSFSQEYKKKKKLM